MSERVHVTRMKQRDHLPWPERHRPKTFYEIEGQESAVAGLQKQVEARSGHSTLIHGPYGCGVSSLARIYAKALLCEAPDAERDPGSSCRNVSCRSCSRIERGASHPNFYVMTAGVDSEADIVKRIEDRARTEAWNAGWLVVILEEVHLLSAATFDALHRRLSRPRERTTYILCTRNVDAVPARTRSVLHDCELGLVSIPSQVRALQKITAAEHLIAEPGVLELIADQSQGHLRVAIGALETLAISGVATLKAAESRFRLGQTRPLEAYFRTLLGQTGADGQLQALDDWPDGDDRKLEGLERLFADLYEEAVFRFVRSDSVMGQLPQDLRMKFAARVEALAKRAKVPRHVLWSRIASHWQLDCLPTRSALRVKALTFRELLENFDQHRLWLGGPANQRLYRTDASLVETRAAWHDGRLRGGLDRDQAIEASGHHLTRQQVEGIWEAASFLVQHYGVLLNCRITIRHRYLSIDDPREVGEFVSQLRQELRQHIQPRSQRDDQLAAFHSISLHEAKGNTGLVSHIVAHVPVAAHDIETWIRTSFLPRRLKKPFDRRGVTVRLWSASVPHAVRRHFQLLRILCRGADPHCSLHLSRGGSTIALPDLIGVPRRLRGSIGRLSGIRRYRPSSGINHQARADAAAELELLSAFSDQAWNWLCKGWELNEHKHRRAALQRLRAGEQAIRAKWPEQEGAESSRRQAMELERYRAEWRAEAGVRSWRGWWTAAPQ